MKKRGLLASFILVMMTNFISAASFYYGASISDFLASINPSSMILVVLFIIFFAVLHNLVFLNLFRGSRGVAAIVSFSISLLMIYGINFMRWDIEGFFYGVGLSSEILSFVIPVIFLLAAIFFIMKFRFHGFLMLLGGLFLVGGLLGIVFERFISGILGIILFGIGLIFWRRYKKESYYGGGGYGERAWGAARGVGKGALGGARAGRGAGGAYKGFRKWNDPGARAGRIAGRTQKWDIRRGRRDLREEKKQSRKAFFKGKGLRDSEGGPSYDYRPSR